MGTREGFLLLDAEDGSPVEVPYEAGPSSFVAVGSSETSMLLYSPAGRLSYVGIPSGKRIAETRTLPGLASLKLTPDKRNLVSLSGGDVVFIDAVNGRTSRSLGLKGVTAFDLDADAAVIASVAGGGLARCRGTERPVALETSGEAPRVPLKSLAVHEDGTVAVAADGVPWSFSIDPSVSGAFPRGEPFPPVSDAAGSPSGSVEGFYLASEGSIYFLGVAEEGEGLLLARVDAAIPRGAARLAAFGSSLWATVAEQTGTAVFRADIGTGEARKAATSASSIRDLSASESGALAVYETRASEAISPKGSKRKWQAVPGLQCATWIDADRIVFGKNLGGGFPSSLFLSKASTGELLPLPHEAVSVFRLARAAENGVAWGFGIADEGGGPRTALWRFTAVPFKAEEIDSAEGERFDASIATFPDGSIAYAFGGKSVRGLSAEGNRIEILSAPVAVRMIRASGALALLVYRDDSFSLLRPGNREPVARYAISGEAGLERID